MRVAQQGCGEPQSAVHPDGEPADALVAEPGETHDIEHLVGARQGSPGGGAEHAQLPPRGPRRMPRYISEEHAHFPRRMADPVQRTPSEVGDSAPGVQFEHEAQGRRLSGARDAEKRGDTARAGLEGEIVHRGRQVAAAGTGQSDGLEHRFSRGRYDRSAAGSVRTSAT